MVKNKISSLHLKAIIVVLIKRQTRLNQDLFCCEDTVRANRRKIILLYALYRQQLQHEYDSKRKGVSDKFRPENRALYGASHSLIPQMKLSDQTSFFNFFRMTPGTFDMLLNIVGPRLQKQETARQPISAKTRLEITIRALCSGELQTSLGLLFRVSQPCVSVIVSETCEILWEALRHRVLPTPNEESWRRTAKEFEAEWQFPHCLGAIDGKLVTLRASILLFLGSRGGPMKLLVIF